MLKKCYLTFHKLSASPKESKLGHISILSNPTKCITSFKPQEFLKYGKSFKFPYYKKLEGRARYAGLILAPAEGFGRGFFGPSGKKELFTLFVPILGHFWCSVVTSVTFSSNLSNFEKNAKKSEKSERDGRMKDKGRTNRNPCV